MRPSFLNPCLLVLFAALVPAAAIGTEVPPTEASAPEPVAGPLADAPAGGLPAERDLNLYQGQVTLISQGAGERRAATARALAQVMVKLTGDPQAANHPVVRRALASAQTLVTTSDTRESSDQQGNTAIGGVPVYRTTMSFAFEPNGVDALVAAAGLKYWGGSRPRPILWLAIDDGRGARLVNAQQLAVVKPLAERGLERGLRFGMPAGSAVEQAAVQTVWSQTPAPMLPLTARYGGQWQLLGRVYRAGAGWTADWVLSDGEAELSRWSFSDASPQRAIASGADGAADAIARRDAVPLQAGEPTLLAIAVTGLRDGTDFTRAMGYLQTLAVVKGLRVVRAEADVLSLELDLAVGAEGFDRFVEAGSVLAAEPARGDGVPTYRLLP
ncbi:DUF2066 domain-containing protein [Arenimonas sp.]|uniref:DUF2066 domain-containing protein n=1 Tax=Arenimonas sp. TaxID=1872635 RepID=UPI002E3586BE|nr:DUF2066 domain-containing protein [Arenimonas sp.]HEX4854357.1 DUF2066 domain-containing protein [Arenimonas sp.]